MTDEVEPIMTIEEKKAAQLAAKLERMRERYREQTASSVTRRYKVKNPIIESN